MENSNTLDQQKVLKIIERFINLAYFDMNNVDGFDSFFYFHDQEVHFQFMIASHVMRVLSRENDDEIYKWISKNVIQEPEEYIAHNF